MDRCGGPYSLHAVIDGSGPGGRWFLLANEYCWFPAIAAVRADSLEDAIDELVDETTWFDIPEEDTDDYDPETVYWSGCGKMADTDHLMIYGEELEQLYFELDD